MSVGERKFRSSQTGNRLLLSRKDLDESAVYVSLGTARGSYMALCKTEQDLSIDGLRYLQLVTAIHARILLRRDLCCLMATKFAVRFALTLHIFVLELAGGKSLRRRSRLADCQVVSSSDITSGHFCPHTNLYS